MYRVEHEGQHEIVYVAGPAADRWIFWKGRVFHGEQSAGPMPDSTPDLKGPAYSPSGLRPPSTQSLTAPMPARVSRILVSQGRR